MNNKRLSLYGGIFFTYIIITRASWLGFSYSTINYTILTLMILSYFYNKYKWVFEELDKKD